MPRAARTITIGGVDYCWNVVAGRGRCVEVTVWPAAMHAYPLVPAPCHLRVTPPPAYRDPWLNADGSGESRGVTPGLVRRLVEAELGRGWQPDDPGSAIASAWEGT